MADYYKYVYKLKLKEACLMGLKCSQMKFLTAIYNCDFGRRHGNNFADLSTLTCKKYDIIRTKLTSYEEKSNLVVVYSWTVFSIFLGGGGCVFPLPKNDKIRISPTDKWK